MYPQTFKEIEKEYRLDNCQSQSEFIEKAVQFYLGHIYAGKKPHYFAETISSLIEGIIENNTNRITRLMFKEALEQGKVFKMLAKAYKYSPEMIAEIHKETLEEVKKVNGYIKLPPSENWSSDD